MLKAFNARRHTTPAARWWPAALLLVVHAWTVREQAWGQTPAVGFRSYWTTDPARTYRTAFDDGATYGRAKSARPVLMNVWYPAAGNGAGSRMKHREYLEIAPTDPALAPLAVKLADYERGVIEGELMGGAPAESKEKARAVLEEAMAWETPSVRGASTAIGRRPVVIYHGGAGSSFEDNARLCERLAGAGFVVIGSAYQAADGSSFNIDMENAGREIEFLLREAAGMANTDLASVGAVGHSAGAQGLLMYAARPGGAIDAVVSLDTTQDYRTLKDPRWPLLVSALARGRESYKTSTMFVAGPTAFFALGDTLARCERVYLTLPGLSHNDYTSQGEMALVARSRWKVDADGEAAAHAREVSARGEELRNAVVNYLLDQLTGDRAARAALESLTQGHVGAGLHIEVMKIGETETMATSGEPTPRRVHRAFVHGGSAGAIAEMKQVERLNPVLFDDGLAFQLMFDLAVSGRESEIGELFDFFLARGIDVRPFLVAQADLFARIGRYPEYLEGCVRIGRVVARDDAATAEMVNNYSTPAKRP